MARRSTFAIIYAPETYEHLDWIEPKYHRLVAITIKEQLTLKGVSIKGQSKVQYQEAVTTAQSEAQSALSQDQVPRAYRGAVRDYFDDLKE